MLLHLGGGTVVFQDQIIGIFSVEPDFFRASHDFLDAADWQKRVIQLDGESRAVVVTGTDIYYSPVSVSTLYSRCIKNHPGID